MPRVCSRFIHFSITKSLLISFKDFTGGDHHAPIKIVKVVLSKVENQRRKECILAFIKELFPSLYENMRSVELKGALELNENHSVSTRLQL